MATTNKLAGQVAEILSSRELVINRGSDDGVKPGMIFAVLSDPIVIEDPATGDELDRLEREKIRVKVSAVRPRISVCTTYRTWAAPMSRRVPPDMEALGRIEEKIIATNEEFQQSKNYSENYIKTKDRVVQVEDGDEA